MEFPDPAGLKDVLRKSLPTERLTLKPVGGLGGDVVVIEDENPVVKYCTSLLVDATLTLA